MLHFFEPDHCEQCRSTKDMEFANLSVNGKDAQGWICEDCGHAHVKAEYRPQPKHWSDNDKSAPATPWGPAQSMQELGEGVVLYGTAGHGGIKLDAARNRKVEHRLRIKGGWYEEDCDWAIVCHTFPELFTPEMQKAAKHTLKTYHFPRWLVGTVSP